MDLSALAQAVTVYMKKYYPTTPEEFNFQAELKAASRWHWSKEKEKIKLVMGPHDNCRVITAAKKAITTWNEELDTKRKKQSAACGQDESEYITGFSL